jgi:hypothetical protein
MGRGIDFIVAGFLLQRVFIYSANSVVFRYYDRWDGALVLLLQFFCYKECSYTLQIVLCLDTMIDVFNNILY